MTTVLEPNEHPQAPATEKPTSDQVALLRHALTTAAAAIADLLAAHPTAEDARTVARSWLLTWRGHQIATKIEKTAGRLAAIAGAR